MENIPKKYQGIVKRAKEGLRKDAIQAHCLRCLDWKREEVRKCTDKGCFLYIVRPYQPPHRISGSAKKQAMARRKRKKYPRKVSKYIDIPKSLSGRVRVNIEFEPESKNKEK